MCQKCRVRHNPNGSTEIEDLPDAVVFQFKNTGSTRNQGFQATFTFSVQPSEGAEPTVTRREILVHDDSSIPEVCVELSMTQNVNSLYYHISWLFVNQPESTDSHASLFISQDNFAWKDVTTGKVSTCRLQLEIGELCTILCKV